MKSLRSFLVNSVQKFIYLPKSAYEIMKTTAELEIKYRVPKVIGCISGTYIPIKRPQTNSRDNFSYKMFHLKNVQTLCDSKGRFLDMIVAGQAQYIMRRFLQIQKSDPTLPVIFCQ